MIGSYLQQVTPNPSSDTQTAGDTQTQGQSAECFPVPLPERDDCLDLAVKPQSSICSNHYSDVRCACSVCVCACTLYITVREL